MPKRPAESPSSQSQSQSQSTQSSQPSKRAAKRAKLASSTPPVPPPTPIVLADPTPSTSALPPPALPPPLVLPNKPLKRVKIPGKLKRLTVAKPVASNPGPAQVLSGAKVGGTSKDAEKVGGGLVEEMMIRRSKGGLGFAGYLKKGVGAFVDRGAATVILHAMTAAIPLCLSLGLAIKDALPGNSSAVNLSIHTGTVAVGDEIVPDDEDEDIVYQTRQKSSVKITLTLVPGILFNGDAPKKSGSGRKRKGWGAGR